MILWQHASCETRYLWFNADPLVIPLYANRSIYQTPKMHRICKDMTLRLLDRYKEWIHLFAIQILSCSMSLDLVRQRMEFINKPAIDEIQLRFCFSLKLWTVRVVQKAWQKTRHVTFSHINQLIEWQISFSTSWIYEFSWKLQEFLVASTINSFHFEESWLSHEMTWIVHYLWFLWLAIIWSKPLLHNVISP